MANKTTTYSLSQRWKARYNEWVEDNRGATAMEFAFIAGPFFFMIFGLLELSLVFIVSTTLEHGVNEASRQIRTGNLQTANGTQAQFEAAVCDELFGLLDCDANLFIDVREFDDFGSSNRPTAIDGDGNFAPNFQFSPGQRSSIVVVRAFYEWDLITPFVSAPLSNLSNGNLLIQSSIAFKNEPFS